MPWEARAATDVPMAVSPVASAKAPTVFRAWAAFSPVRLPRRVDAAEAYRPMGPGRNPKMPPSRWVMPRVPAEARVRRRSSRSA